MVHLSLYQSFLWKITGFNPEGEFFMRPSNTQPPRFLSYLSLTAIVSVASVALFVQDLPTNTASSPSTLIPESPVGAFAVEESLAWIALGLSIFAAVVSFAAVRTRRSQIEEAGDRTLWIWH